MSDLDQRIRDKLLRQGHDIGMLHRGLAAVLDACKELDEFDAETYSDAAAFRVRESLAYALGVSGEDRSEPTPAPREPRVWQQDDPDPAENRLVIRDIDGDEATYDHGCWHWTLIDGEAAEDGTWGPWEWPIADMAYPATEVLSEVATPEGTS